MRRERIDVREGIGRKNTLKLRHHGRIFQALLYFHLFNFPSFMFFFDIGYLCVNSYHGGEKFKCRRFDRFDAIGRFRGGSRPAVITIGKRVFCQHFGDFPPGGPTGTGFTLVV